MSNPTQLSGAGWRRWNAAVGEALRQLVQAGALSPSLARRLALADHRQWANEIVDHASELANTSTDDEGPDAA
jgi:hypothetical protein